MRDITFIKQGYVTIKTSCSNCEKLLNICSGNDIIVRNIRYIDDDTVIMSISLNDYKNILPMIRKEHIRVKICDKKGLPFFINAYKKRYSLIIGLLVCVLIITLLSSFIWEIEVRGNINVDARDVIRVLGENGLAPGSSKYGKNIVRLRDKIILNVDGVAWAWIYLKGSKAVVTIKETVPKTEIIPLDKPSSIIAKCDAMIFDIVAERGTPLVKKGDGVIKGEVLISGISESMHSGGRLVHSFGKVYGRTWASLSREYSLDETKKTPTGKKTNRYTINFFKKRIKLYRNAGISYTSYDTIHKEYNLFENNDSNGISIMKDSFIEMLEEPVFDNEESLKQTAVSSLLSEIIASKDETATLESYTTSFEKTDASTVKVTVDAVFIEDIGVEISITDKELNDNQ